MAGQPVLTFIYPSQSGAIYLISTAIYYSIKKITNNVFLFIIEVSVWLFLTDIQSQKVQTNPHVHSILLFLCSCLGLANIQLYLGMQNIYERWTSKIHMHMLLIIFPHRIILVFLCMKKDNQSLFYFLRGYFTF